MEIDTHKKGKILTVSLLITFFVLVATLTVVLFLCGVIGGDKIQSKQIFKSNLVVENINQKINIKDFFINKDIHSNDIHIKTNNSDIVSVEGTFVSLNSKGLAEIEVGVKNKKQTLSVAVVDDKSNESEIKEILSLPILVKNTILVGDSVDFCFLGKLGEIANITFSNYIANFNNNKIVATKEGYTTVSIVVSYQTLNSLKPINICSTFDLFVEGTLSNFNIRVLDKNFNQTDTINFVSKSTDIAGYIEIEDVKYLSSNNLQTNFDFCEFFNPIYKNGKFLLPFKLKNWGSISGSVSYIGGQGEFKKEISFNAFNEVYTKFPTKLTLDVFKSGEVASCVVTTYIDEDVVSLPFSVVFVKDGVESSPIDTSYISNFEVDSNTILFKIKEEVDFSIKVVLINAPYIFVLKVVN